MAGKSPAPSNGVAEQRDLFDAQHWETAYRGFDPDDVPHLLIQLQDDLSRARKREALWLSVILHLMVVILLWNSEKLMMLLPHRTVELAIQNTDQSKDATFLELPPDEQKLTRRPEAKVLSDKDRIATSKSPQINREELRKILQSRNPGEPGMNTPQSPAPAPAAPPAQAQNQSPPAPLQQNSQGLAAPQPNNQVARLQVPPQTRAMPDFKSAMTPGRAIEQAVEAAAANRGYAGSGQSGDSGLSRGQNGAKALSQAEILTDTMGVDFGPYVTRILQTIKQNWYSILPPSVFPPIRKQGKLTIDFVILKDGKVSGMTLHTPSGDVALDRAAWGSITASNPFPPLPKEFPGQIFGLRLTYFYNLEPGADVR